MVQPDPHVEEFDEPYVDQTDPPPPRTQQQEATYKPSTSPWFTFDDIPHHKWRDRIHEFGAWIDLQITNQQVTLRQVLQEFVSKFTGILRDWFQHLSEYQRLQVVQAQNAGMLLGAIHKEFIGDFNIIKKREKQEFFEMKCYSLDKRDLQKHYQRMIGKYYLLNGGNDVNLRHTFISSLPDEIQPEINKSIHALGRDIFDISIGEIYQFALAAVDKLCETHQMFKNMQKRAVKLKPVCKKSYLKIKCKDHKECCRPTKKKSHFQSHSRPPDKRFIPRRSKARSRFFKPRKSFSKVSRCFICRKMGHFTKNCPRKSKRDVKMIH